MLRLYQVKDDMAAVVIHSLAIAKPFVAVMMQALHYSLHFVDTAVGTGMWWQISKVIRLKCLLALSCDAHKRTSNLTLVSTSYRTRNFRHGIVDFLVAKSIRFFLKLIKLVVEIIRIVVVL